MNICPNCGFSIKEGETTCNACKTPIPVLNSSNNNQQQVPVPIPNEVDNDNDLIEAYIGENAKDFKDGSFSFATLIFAQWYILYRKV